MLKKKHSHDFYPRFPNNDQLSWDILYMDIFHFVYKVGAIEVCVCDKNASTLPQVMNGHCMKNRYIEVFHHVEVETSRRFDSLEIPERERFGDFKVSKYLVT